MIDIDRYRRGVGRIYLGERFINAEMARDGLARRYVQYDKLGEFTAAEAEARAGMRLARAIRSGIELVRLLAVADFCENRGTRHSEIMTNGPKVYPR